MFAHPDAAYESHVLDALPARGYGDYLMNAKAIVIGAAKHVALTLGFLICFILPTTIIPVQQQLQQAMQQSASTSTFMLSLLGLSFTTVLVVSYAVRHAVVGGIRLICALIITLFGFLTAMGQIETFYFRSAFPLLGSQEILDIVYRGFLTALLFVPIAVITWRKTRGDGMSTAGIAWKSWLWKAPVLALLYMVIYFSFGYWVAWQFPETRLLYTGSTEILGVTDHLQKIFSDSPFFAPLQFIRGLLWIAFATPLILALVGRRRETIISLALLGGLFGLQILLPNPLFPEMVRYAHALETIPSTALYGALIGIVLAPAGSPQK